MAIFSVYVVNKAGGLIYQLDSYAPRAEAEKTFSYPLDLLLKLHDERVLVAFGQRDGIRVGHAVLAINGMDVNGKHTADGKEVLEYLGNPANYPVSVRFGRPRLTSNEKLMLASMFHSCPGWDYNSNPGMYPHGEWNSQPFSLQDNNPTTEPHQPGSPHKTLTTPKQLLLSLGVCRVLVTGPLQITKIHGYSSPSYKMV
ncbi:trafficking protein particle complex subunit 4 isoform 2-T2 [Glossophaga mutica]